METIHAATEGTTHNASSGSLVFLLLGTANSTRDTFLSILRLFNSRSWLSSGSFSGTSFKLNPFPISFTISIRIDPPFLRSRPIYTLTSWALHRIRNPTPPFSIALITMKHKVFYYYHPFIASILLLSRPIVLSYFGIDSLARHSHRAAVCRTSSYIIGQPAADMSRSASSSTVSEGLMRPLSHPRTASWLTPSDAPIAAFDSPASRRD